MSSLDTINTMLNNMPDSRLPEVLDFLRYLRRKDENTRDIEKKLAAWDRFVEAIHAAGDEHVSEFERVKFNSKTTL
ncbi:hypothetical protein FACS1894187_15230 [Synergistales bacterium]|nr:hypothetical protein FACS1894187_15230 [Synergistales bacterium]